MASKNERSLKDRERGQRGQRVTPSPEPGRDRRAGRGADPPPPRTPRPRAAQRAASDARALASQQAPARRKRQPSATAERTAALAQIMSRSPTKVAFAVLASEHPTVFVVQCPHCGDEHAHQPGQELVQVCPAQSKKYAVMIPLSQLPEPEQ